MQLELNYQGVCKFFSDQSKNDGGRNRDFGILKIMKLVYISHGFLLASLGRSFVGKDKFEAWPYGPVLPRMYRSYKKTLKSELSSNNGDVSVRDRLASSFYEGMREVEPDSDEHDVLSNVYSSYGKLGAFDLVALTHRPGSPWYESYVPSQNETIYDSLIREHYEDLIAE